jgi:dTDP-glucose 4,6-dehydratase
MTKRIAILGANSFSGQDFTDLILDSSEYDQVIGISRSAERSDMSLRYKLNKNLSKFKYHQIDFNNQTNQLLAVLDSFQPHHIVNFAAQSEVAPSWVHPEDWFRTNTVSLAQMINHLNKASYLERYLHVSSPEVYGSCQGTVTEDSPVNPSTPYAASKASADLLLSVYKKQYNFPLLTVRATNVYGSRQQLFKIIPRTAIYLNCGKTIELHGGGQAIKSYIHIRDVSEGELLILQKGLIGQLYHLSPDNGIAVKDVVRHICNKLNKDFDTSTRIVEERPGQDAAYIIDSSKARTTLGWKPKISIEEGLNDVIEWVNSYWEQIKNQSLVYEHKR